MSTVGIILSCWLMHIIGNFGDVDSFDYSGNDVEQHLDRIKENNSLLQQSGALPIVYSALRKACEEHNSQKYEGSSITDIMLESKLISCSVVQEICMKSMMKLRFF
jgi:hypothetical protein